MSRSLDQLARVYGLREDRARRRLQQRREDLARIASGLAGADELQAALSARIRAPAVNVRCAADLAAHHDHTRQVGQKIKAIEQLKVRARGNQEQLHHEVTQLGRQWRKAQARTSKAESLQNERGLELQVRAQLDEEGQVLESWLTARRLAQVDQRFASTVVSST